MHIGWNLHGSKIPVGRRFHSKQSNDLEEMVLDDVAQTAGSFVKCAALPDAEVLG